MSQGYRISTGRGGAGNMHFSNEKIVSPKIIPEGSQTPNILSPVYSTGRGGVGNMRKNIDPTITRLAQDVGDVSLHHYQNNKNKKKKLNKQNDKNKNCNNNNNNNNNNSIDSLDTNEDTITDLDVANEPFIASLENNAMEPSNSHHSQYLFQAVRSHTDDNDEDSDEDNSIVLDEDDYITPITNEDLFEDNNMSKVTNVLSKIRSHISPIQSPNKSTINQQEKVKFMNTDPKYYSGGSGSNGGGAGVDTISNNKQSNNNTKSNNTNSNKLRLVKTISRSRDGTTKAISLKKTRRENSCGGNKSPPPIVIGRGGAGNIVSPINTNSKHNRNVSLSNSNKKKSSSSSSKGNNNDTNNIPPKKKEKKGFLSSIMNIFA